MKTVHILESVENGGCGLQSIHFLQDATYLETITQTLNKDLPIGTAALRESLSMAIGLPGYGTTGSLNGDKSFKGHNTQTGPFEFSPNFLDTVSENMDGE
jgi:hypothetical protein